MRKRIIAIDFDGTLVYGKHIVGGARESMQRLRDAGYFILIHSCNEFYWIQRVLNENNIPYDYIWNGNGKPVADWYIDDRAVTFKGDWDEALQEVFNGDAAAEARQE